jgi:hypothetical protein
VQIAGDCVTTTATSRKASTFPAGLIAAGRACYSAVLPRESRRIRALIGAPAPIDPSLWHPMELAPLTEVDDGKFRPALRSNRDIPDFVRGALS